MNSTDRTCEGHAYWWERVLYHAAFACSRRLTELVANVVTTAMVNNCCVCGCKNYVGKRQGLRFFRFPLAHKERCAKWAAAVRRQNWQPTKSSRICNEHFVSGKTARLVGNIK